MGFRWLSGKDPTCQSRSCRRCRFDPWRGEDPLEEKLATHASILGWKIPWAEEPGALQSMGSQRVEHDWGTEHTPMRALISVTKTGFFLNHASLPIPATEEDRHLYGGKLIQFHTFYCHKDFTSILHTDPWTTLMMPWVVISGRRGPKDSHMGDRLAASSWDLLQILQVLCLTIQCWGKESFPRRCCPSRTTFSSFSSLETQWGQGQGRDRGKELQGAHTLVSWSLFNHLDDCCQRSGGKKKTCPPDFSIQGPLWKLQSSFLLSLNCLPYSWLWNHLVWLCWHDNNYSHFH